MRKLRFTFHSTLRPPIMRNLWVFSAFFIALMASVCYGQVLNVNLLQNPRYVSGLVSWTQDPVLSPVCWSYLYVDGVTPVATRLYCSAVWSTLSQSVVTQVGGIYSLQGVCSTIPGSSGYNSVGFVRFFDNAGGLIYSCQCTSGLSAGGYTTVCATQNVVATTTSITATAYSHWYYGTMWYGQWSIVQTALPPIVPIAEPVALPAPPLVPIAEPEFVPFDQNIPEDDVDIPQQMPSVELYFCDMATKPTSDAICFRNDTWFVLNDLTTSITISSAQILVGGNILLGNGTIITQFESFAVSVSGCFDVGSLEVTLTQEQLNELMDGNPKHSTVISSLAGLCPNSTSSDAINLLLNSPNTDPCKQLQYSTSVEHPEGTPRYNLIFSVQMSDTGNCNKKKARVWPIIVGVVLGVVALVVIILAILFTTVPSLRKIVRPFSNSEGRRSLKST